MTEPHADRDAAPESRRQPSELLHYPTNHVVAIVDTPERATAALTALAGGGFSGSEVVVGCGREVADALDATSGRTGLANLAIRVAERLGTPFEETEVKERYEEALRDGKIVLSVLAPDGERKERAAELLAEHGAHFINYLGRFSIETIQR
jgi:hypothetical protein